MKTIRSNVFETNSSSMHAICITNSYPNMKNQEITFDLGIDFSSRTLIKRVLPIEKASYIFHLICKHFETTYIHKPVSNTYTEFEKTDIREKFLKFTDFLIMLNNVSHNSYQDVECKFINYVLYFSESNDFAYINTKNGDWSSTGCYGHDSFEIELGLTKLYKLMDNYIEYNDIKLLDLEFNWYGILRFILNDSIIIQNTDECDNEDRIEMNKTIIDTINRHMDEQVTVIWPIGG